MNNIKPDRNTKPAKVNKTFENRYDPSLNKKSNRSNDSSLSSFIKLLFGFKG